MIRFFIGCPIGTFANLRLMESYAVKHVIVRIHHVITSMDARACPVGTNRIFFNQLYFLKQTKIYNSLSIYSSYKL